MTDTKKTKTVVSAMLFCLLFGILPNTVFGQLAFPGVEGFGACSVGGRGGRVIKVTNLNDRGPGSLREAVTASGPRIVVFDVSGIIDLDSPISISKPYLTIAGQTSPGGVLITGWPFWVMTHDAIIRHVRFRNGCQKCYAAGNCEDTGDTFSIYGLPAPYGQTDRLDAYNIVVDHCSMSWGCDETFDLGADHASVYGITVSNCIIAEGVNDAHPKANHAYGLFLWGKHTLPGEAIRASFHRNLVMSFYARLPMANFNVSFDFINNVVYNFYSTLSPTLEPITGYTIEANMVHNYIKPGPNSGTPFPTGVGRETTVFGDGIKGHVTGTPYEMIYTVGNIGYSRQTQTGDDWIVSEGWSPTNLLSKDWQKTIPFPSPEGVPITTTIMSESYAQTIVENAGATKPFRDGVDTRLISEYKAGNKGNYTTIKSYPDDFPTFQHLPAPADNDNDGMPDIWETANGLNANDPADNNGTDLSEEGYTNIEMYINELADSNVTTSSIGKNGIKGQQDIILMSYPNPFAPSTTLKYSIKKLCNVQLKIYNQLGQEVYLLVNEQQPAGEYIVGWDGKDMNGHVLPNGIYVCRLIAGKQSYSIKMLYWQ